MSGAISASTIAAVVGAAAAVGGTAYGIVNGQAQQGAQKQALKRQNQAQQTAEAATLSTQRKNETAQNAAAAKTPDVTAILARAATAGNAGSNGTMLTGKNGVDPNALSLGKNTLLGA